MSIDLLFYDDMYYSLPFLNFEIFRKWWNNCVTGKAESKIIVVTK